MRAENSDPFAWTEEEEAPINSSMHG